MFKDICKVDSQGNWIPRRILWLPFSAWKSQQMTAPSVSEASIGCAIALDESWSEDKVHYGAILVQLSGDDAVLKLTNGSEYFIDPANDKLVT